MLGTTITITILINSIPGKHRGGVQTKVIPHGAQAKVTQLHVSIRVDEDVLGLNIPVYHVVHVEGGEGEQDIGSKILDGGFIKPNDAWMVLVGRDRVDITFAMITLMHGLVTLWRRRLEGMELLDRTTLLLFKLPLLGLLVDLLGEAMKVTTVHKF